MVFLCGHGLPMWTWPSYGHGLTVDMAFLSHGLPVDMAFLCGHELPVVLLYTKGHEIDPCMLLKIG